MKNLSRDDIVNIYYGEAEKFQCNCSLKSNKKAAGKSSKNAVFGVI